MTRPLIAVTADDEIRQHLAFLDGPVALVDDFFGITDLYDELLLEHGAAPVIAVGQDFDGSLDQPRPHFSTVILFTDPDSVDWHEVFWLAPDQLLRLPDAWPEFRALLETT